MIRKKDLIKLKLLLLSLHKQEEKKVISNVKGEFKKTIGLFKQKYNLIGVNFTKNKDISLVTPANSPKEYISLNKGLGKNNRMIRLSIAKTTIDTLGYNSEINYCFDKRNLEVSKTNRYEKYSRLMRLVNYKNNGKMDQLNNYSDEFCYIKTLKKGYPYLYNWLVDIYPYIENDFGFEKIKKR